MVVSFVGHSIVHSHDELKNLVKEQMRKSVFKEKSVTCLLGGRGEFDMICAAACRELKQADFVIAYVNHDYGGAYKAFKVAKHNRKNVINLCDIIK